MEILAVCFVISTAFRNFFVRLLTFSNISISAEKNYYKDLIAIFNKKPQTLYNILKKYYRFQDMTNKEKKYLNKLSFYEVDKATLEVDDLHELKQKIADDKSKNITNGVNDLDNLKEKSDQFELNEQLKNESSEKYRKNELDFIKKLFIQN